MKIYTRTGDKGQTGLLGGQRLAKTHVRIEAYGTVDELNSQLGLLRAQAPSHEPLIQRVQVTLFNIGSRLASGSAEDAAKFKVPEVTDSEVIELEKAMDAMDRDLAPMRNFILPGGHQAIAQAHVCRAVCRRAERRALELDATDAVPGAIVRYLNRLSDLLFVLARHLHFTLQIPEIPWRPGA